jgi:GT2 family glycosyltransferase
MSPPSDRRAAAASVLICTRNRPQLLTDTLRSVLAADPLPGEVVIVDQSDEVNATAAGLRQAGCAVRYFHSPTVGASRARNEGLRLAERDWVVLLDDDMLVERAWLTTLLAGLPAAEMPIATGNVLPAPPEGAAGVIPPAALVQRDEGTFRGRQQADVIPGANVALPRASALAVGGYDERLGPGTRFPAAEDNDFGHRLMLLGCEVHHVPAAVTLHRAWRSRSELVRLRWAYGRGKGAFYAKHAGLRDRWMVRRALADLGRRLRRAFTSLPRAPKETAAEAISIAAILVGGADWFVTVRLPARLRRLTSP